MQLACEVVKDRLHYLAWLAPRRRKQYDAAAFCNESGELFGSQAYGTAHLHLIHNATSSLEIATPQVLRSL